MPKSDDELLELVSVATELMDRYDADDFRIRRQPHENSISLVWITDEE